MASRSSCKVPAKISSKELRFRPTTAATGEGSLRKLLRAAVVHLRSNERSVEEGPRAWHLSQPLPRVLDGNALPAGCGCQRVVGRLAG